MAHPTIHIQVQTQHLPEQSSPEGGVHAFAYTITLRNDGPGAAQLIARHWLIEDADGQRQEVRGLGVVGQQPLIAPGEGYRYTSNCHLNTDSGTMRGSYFFVTEEGERFDVPIPVFVLDAADPRSGPTGTRTLH